MKHFHEIFTLENFFVVKFLEDFRKTIHEIENS